MKTKLLLLLLALLLAFVPAQAQATQTLTVFAAASLTDAFTEIGQAFENAHPGVSVVFNFGGSSTLAAQLVNGAPADVFASANGKQMQAAQDAGRIAGTPQAFAHNRLVLIVPADNPAGIQTLADLTKPGIKLVLAAPSVPVRAYTNAMLTKLAADPAYGSAYKAAVLANLVSEEDNVRQVSAKVALGEADAGIVYRSDVTPDINDQVIMFDIPDAVNKLATYPIALTNDTGDPQLAQAFVDYVLSDAGQKVLVKWNFLSIRAPEATPTVAPTEEVTPTAEATDTPSPLHG